MIDLIECYVALRDACQGIIERLRMVESVEKKLWQRELILTVQTILEYIKDELSWHEKCARKYQTSLPITDAAKETDSETRRGDA